ncbi:hypothetical protein ACOKFD_08070 [Flagellimonas sp. S174]|nr:hypothetical protein [uncultured Allomuricauda sp.]
MKVLILRAKKEFSISDNRVAAISCLIISITVFFIMAVLGRETLL